MASRRISYGLRGDEKIKIPPRRRDYFFPMMIAIPPAIVANPPPKTITPHAAVSRSQVQNGIRTPV